MTMRPIACYAKKSVVIGRHLWCRKRSDIHLSPRRSALENGLDAEGKAAKKDQRIFMKVLLLFALVVCVPCSVYAQGSSKLVSPLLAQPLQTPSVVADQLSHFMLQSVPPLVLPSRPEQWD